MTQLFDTTTYEYLAEAHTSGDAPRHLRSMPTGRDVTDDTDRRSTRWRLDEHTIEIGRKGIQAARQALQDAAVPGSTPKRARTAA